MNSRTDPALSALRLAQAERAQASAFGASSFGAANHLIAPVLSRDMSLMLGQLQVEMIRASVVDIETMAFGSSWSNVEGWESEISSPWAPSMIAQLEDLNTEQTLAQKLSPHFWAFAWRMDEGHAAVAAAFYSDAREVHNDAQTALVRLVCDVGLRGAQGGKTDPGLESLPASPPPIERRRRAGTEDSGQRTEVLGVAAALVVLALTVTATALAFNEAAALRAEAKELQALSEATMTQTLSSALATRDYGEVQMHLSSFASIGYFSGAVVTNQRQRVISSSGKVGLARIGEDLPPALAQTARTFELVQSGTPQGQLLVLGLVGDGLQASGGRWLLLAAMLGCLATGAGAALLGMRYRWRQARKV